MVFKGAQRDCLKYNCFRLHAGRQCNGRGQGQGLGWSTGRRVHPSGSSPGAFLGLTLPLNQRVFSYRALQGLKKARASRRLFNQGKSERTFSPGVPLCIVFLLLPSLDPTRISSLLCFQPKQEPKSFSLFTMTSTKTRQPWHFTKLKSELQQRFVRQEDKTK